MHLCTSLDLLFTYTTQYRLATISRKILEKEAKWSMKLLWKASGLHHIEGLVDADSEEIFYKQLEEKKVQWDKIEKEIQVVFPAFMV